MVDGDMMEGCMEGWLNVTDNSQREMPLFISTPTQALLSSYSDRCNSLLKGSSSPLCTPSDT